MPRRHLPYISLFALLLSASACGDGSVDFFSDGAAPPDPARVSGGACTLNAECAPGSLCLLGEDFPAGSCALPCQLSASCPSATFCVELDDSAGYSVPSACLPACVDEAQCRLDYECGSAKRVDDEVEVKVCMN